MNDDSMSDNSMKKGEIMDNPIVRWVVAEMQRLKRALGYSLEGLKAAFASEAAFRLELALALVLIPLGIMHGGIPVRRALLVGSVLLVLLAELVNTAIEVTHNRMGDEH